MVVKQCSTYASSTLSSAAGLHQVQSKPAISNPCDPVVLLLLLQTEFTPLHQWEREYIIFEKLHRKPHFMHFRMWKQFALWRRAVRTRKTTEARYDTKTYVAKHLSHLSCISRQAAQHL